ncbi:hypothetical protein NDU88_001980 [Pleurodeles waltl]|uniref:Uncharacterized protein n=1 Tax=Pleurodeles waltl TaxID=8319 RepID=A0AAV7WNP2_PLEWA|nr:hypothetical protein NDU88_001980 [Pleurodeles waltl]
MEWRPIRKLDRQLERLRSGAESAFSLPSHTAPAVLPGTNLRPFRKQKAPASQNQTGLENKAKPVEKAKRGPRKRSPRTPKLLIKRRDAPGTKNTSLKGSQTVKQGEGVRGAPSAAYFCPAQRSDLRFHHCSSRHERSSHGA